MTDSGAQKPAPVGPPAASGIDATTPHSARIWNYWLGGKDNYAVDRGAGDQRDAYNNSGATPYYLYEPAEIAELFTGLALTGPGLVSCPEWEPAAEPTTSYTNADMLAAIGRKP